MDVPNQLRKEAHCDFGGKFGVALCCKICHLGDMAVQLVSMMLGMCTCCATPVAEIPHWL